MSSQQGLGSKAGESKSESKGADFSGQGWTDFMDPMTAFGSTKLLALGTMFQGFMKTFEYAGYNPRTTYDQLVKLFQGLKAETGKAPLTSADFFSDMVMAVSFYVTRGTKINAPKTLNKSSDNGVKVMKELISRYQIRDERPSKPTDITIARLAGAFPIMVAIQMGIPGVRIIGEIIPGLPSGLHSPIGASLIPRDNVTLWAAWRLHSANFTKVIQGDSKGIVANNLAYGKIVRDGVYVPELTRISTVTDLYVNEFPNVSALRQVCFIITWPRNDFVNRVVASSGGVINADVATNLGLNDLSESNKGKFFGIFNSLTVVDRVNVDLYTQQLMLAPEPAATISAAGAPRR